MNLARSVLLGGLPSVSRPAMVVSASEAGRPPQQAGATPWGAIIDELGIGPTDLRVATPQPGAASEPDVHGWNAIVAALNDEHAHLGANAQSATRPGSSPETAATDWTTILAETGLIAGSNQPNASFGADPAWAMLAAEVAVERRAENKGGRDARSQA